MLTVTIHRGRNEIGGNCVEIDSGKTRILLDIGQPLSGEFVTIPQNLKTVDAVIISHPHQDHYGLIEQIPKNVSVYIGLTAEKLIEALQIFINKQVPDRIFKPIEDKQIIDIGDFKITPYLVDHSAFDSFAFLVEGNGERIFYTGDLRMHGRKISIMDKLLKHPPSNIDKLIIEGTMLDRDNQKFRDESAVENAMVEILNSSNAASFFIAPSQNVDRLVSAFRACKKTNREFVIDIYTAWVLRQISNNPKTKNIPDISWGEIKVLSKGWTAARQYLKLKENRNLFGRFTNEIYSQNVVITQQEIEAEPERYLIKTSFTKPLIDRLNLKPCSVIYSMWEGYLSQRYNPTGWNQLISLKEDPQINFQIIHTSGHAIISDLKKLVEALKPNKILPIHTEDGDRLLQILNENPNQIQGGRVAQFKSDLEINAVVDEGRGKSTGWPKFLQYHLENESCSVTLKGKIDNANLRKLDCWSLAFYDYCREQAENKPRELFVDIPAPPPLKVAPNIEALKRRISYLNSINSFQIQLSIAGNEYLGYSLKDLIKRPSNEIVNTDYDERKDDDKPGRLEKDFQAYLFGKGKNDTVRTNERLAILGEDFRDLNRKKKPFVMEREFPTGVFNEKITAKTRVLPTNFIDVVSFNKWQELSLIELKVNDSALPVISQALDYALFFASYQKQLWKVIEAKLGRKPKKKNFVCYIANNCFHSRFDTVAKYYSPKNRDIPFKIKKVVLGFTDEI